MKILRLKNIIVTSMAVTLLLTGCGNTTANIPETSTTAASNTTASSTAASVNNNSNSSISMEEAKEIALAHADLSADKVTFTKAKLDTDHGASEYEIEFVSDNIKYEYEISEADGTVVQFSQEAVTDTGNNASKQTVSMEEAKEIALNDAGLSADKVTFTKTKLDYDDGVAEYEIEFVADGKEYEYNIDASSGTITESDVESR